MIFAAGLGTRLAPLTDDKPKALVEINGKTLLENAIDYLQKFGVDRVVINVHHYSELVLDFISTLKRPEIEIVVSVEDALLETAGGLSKARDYFTDDFFIIYNVDVVTDIDLKSMIDFHVSKGASATLAVRKRNTSRYFLFDNDDVLLGWKNEKTGELRFARDYSGDVNQFAFSGIHVFNKDLLPMLGDVRKWSLTEFYLRIAEWKKIVGFSHNDGYWFDCGTVESLRIAEKKICE